jgi:hypothetical protein
MDNMLRDKKVVGVFVDFRAPSPEEGCQQHSLLLVKLLLALAWPGSGPGPGLALAGIVVNVVGSAGGASELASLPQYPAPHLLSNGMIRHRNNPDS